MAVHDWVTGVGITLISALWNVPEAPGMTPESISDWLCASAQTLPLSRQTHLVPLTGGVFGGPAERNESVRAVGALLWSPPCPALRSPWTADGSSIMDLPEYQLEPVMPAPYIPLSHFSQALNFKSLREKPSLLFYMFPLHSLPGALMAQNRAVLSRRPSLPSLPPGLTSLVFCLVSIP